MKYTREQLTQALNNCNNVLDIYSKYSKKIKINFNGIRKVIWINHTNTIPEKDIILHIERINKGLNKEQQQISIDAFISALKEAVQR